MMLLSSRSVSRVSKLFKFEILVKEAQHCHMKPKLCSLPASIMFLKDRRSEVTCGNSLVGHALPSVRTGSSTPSMRSSSLITCGSTTSAFFFLGYSRFWRRYPASRCDILVLTGHVMPLSGRCSMAIFATFAFEEPWPRLAKASAMSQPPWMPPSRGLRGSCGCINVSHR